MNPLTSSDKTLLEQCSEAFKNVRGSVWAAAALLYQVRAERAFQGQYKSLGEYVESELQISQGFASKLLASWERYVIEGKVSHAKLLEVDSEKAYLALKTEGDPDLQLSRALTLSRRELRQDREEVGDHEHKWVCRICGISYPNAE